MRFALIENSGQNNLRDYLNGVLCRADRIDIAVAFITQAGLTEILQALRQVAGRGQVRILTGLYQGFTEPEALRMLLRVQDQTEGRLSVRLSTEPNFHRKLYLVKRTRTAVTTPDGRHFIACKPVRGIPKRKLTKRFFDRLKFAGLISSRVDAHRGRKISPTRWNAFVEVFQGR